jgi:hypothetical protein
VQGKDGAGFERKFGAVASPHVIVLVWIVCARSGMKSRLGSLGEFERMVDLLAD